MKQWLGVLELRVLSTGERAVSEKRFATFRSVLVSLNHLPLAFWSQRLCKFSHSRAYLSVTFCVFYSDFRAVLRFVPLFKFVDSQVDMLDLAKLVKKSIHCLLTSIVFRGCCYIKPCFLRQIDIALALSCVVWRYSWLHHALRPSFSRQGEVIDGEGFLAILLNTRSAQISQLLLRPLCLDS